MKSLLPNKQFVETGEVEQSIVQYHGGVLLSFEKSSERCLVRGNGDVVMFHFAAKPLQASLGDVLIVG